MKTMTINNWRTEMAGDGQMFEAISQKLSSLPGESITETVFRWNEDNDWQFFEKIPQGVIRHDSEGHIMLVNPGGEQLLKSTMASIKARRLWDPYWNIIRQDDSVFSRDQHPAIIALKTGEPVMNVVMSVCSPESEHGRWFIVNSVPEFKIGQVKPNLVISIFTEITILKQNQDQLCFLAYHDPLTELPNRLLLNDRIDHALQNSQRNGLQFALLFLDLDNFKRINDTFGHSIGDQLLKEVVARIKVRVRGEDTVSRLAGDEFIILVEDIADIKNIAKLARKILNAFQAPFSLQGYQINITASIGISVFPDDGGDTTTLINAADAAMYHAKQEGRNNFQFDIAAFTVAALEKLNMENALRLALQNRELLLYYRPQVSLSSGEIVGVESSLQWQHPTLGMILPSQFIPIAKETGLIISLGAWMLETACKQMKTWIKEGFSAQKMAVSISGNQILRSDIVNTVQQALAVSGLEPCYLELEFSESDLTDSMERSVEILNKLSHLGVSVAIEGYGTGYSSLNHITRLPVSKFKIDRALVLDQLCGINNQEIVRAVIALGHSLHIQVLADGIETEVQQQMLCNMGCDAGQGDLYSLPSQP